MERRGWKEDEMTQEKGKSKKARCKPWTRKDLTRFL
jgi:hypothetical protein